MNKLSKQQSLEIGNMGVNVNYLQQENMKTDYHKISLCLAKITEATKCNIK